MNTFNKLCYSQKLAWVYTCQHTGRAMIRVNGGGLAPCIDDVTITEMLKAEGYATGSFGKWGMYIQDSQKVTYFELSILSLIAHKAIQGSLFMEPYSTGYRGQHE